MAYEFSVDWTSRAIPLWKRCFRQINKPDVSVLEIGTYEGRSSCWFSDNVLDHDMATLDCVDPYTQDNHIGENKLLNEKRYHCFIKNILQSKNSNKITHYKMTSDDFFKNHHNTYDFIYVDGGHLKDQVMRDLLNAESRLNKGGILIIDDVWYLGDFNSGEHDVQKALEEVLPFETLICLQDGLKNNHKQSAYLKTSKGHNNEQV